MLSNAYFLAKFRFDTAENESAKNLQNFANFPNFANPNPHHAAFEGSLVRPPQNKSTGDYSLFFSRDVLEMKSETTKIAWPKNAHAKVLGERARLIARPRNGPSVTSLPLSRKCKD